MGYIGSINVQACREVASVFKEITRNTAVDPFTDVRYYPPQSCDTETIIRYFIFMVAIDHRTSRFRPFEGLVDGEFYHGADLLYRLGMKKFMEEPDFFSPERMATITSEEVSKWLRVRSYDGDVTIWDYEVRAELLRDVGVKILQLYNGSCYELVRSSGSYLKYHGGGFIERLKVFKAYSDPVEKKAYLLAKFLSRRGILKYSDVENSEVPVDNHVTRIALRLGLIDLSQHYLFKVVMKMPFNYEEDIGIRLKVRDAFKLVSYFANVDPLLLDDILWLFGRTCCTRGKPRCVNSWTTKCKALSLGRPTCVFRDTCLYVSKGIKVDEHLFEDTYYY